MDYPKKERRILAIKSREAPPTFGSPERQKLINEIHEYMLSKAPMTPQTNMPDAQTNDEENQQNNAVQTAEIHPHPAEDNEIIDQPDEIPSETNAAQTSEVVPAKPTTGHPQLQKPIARAPKPADDRLFTWAALGLTFAIFFLLLKKFLKANGHEAIFMNGS